ncbi:MAG: phosphatase PAP2 family protein [Xanthobacteraceae bacterium]
MTRIGLAVALAIALLVGVIFGIYPDLDIRISRLFLERGVIPIPFALRIDPFLMAVRNAALWIETAVVAPAIVALLIKIILPRTRLILPGRAAVFLVTTLVLAPGLFVNVLAKDNWGRPRPIDIPEFGGDQPFVPWWDPRGVCDKNCSFVAGDPSGAFWMLAPASLAPPSLRPAAYAAALTFGVGIGLLRIAFGAHFFSDVVFSGFFTFLIVWLMHGLIYRWPRTRFSDAAVERTIERVMLPVDAFFAVIIRRLLERMRRFRGEGEPRDRPPIRLLEWFKAQMSAGHSGAASSAILLFRRSSLAIPDAASWSNALRRIRPAVGGQPRADAPPRHPTTDPTNLP